MGEITDTGFGLPKHITNKMTASEHMQVTGPMAIYPHNHTGSKEELMYLALEICDEAGEVAGKIKKLWRDGTFNRIDIAKELGDVYWPLHRLIQELEMTPEEVMYMNWEKLSSRQERGVLGGSGDNR